MNGAFGNYRDLMRDVTLNPAMGRYLNMLNNRSQAVTGVPPNENYPRELMQLFTHRHSEARIPNGTPMLDAAGAPVPAYTEARREGAGAHLHGLDVRRRQSGDRFRRRPAVENYRVPMEPVARVPRHRREDVPRRRRSRPDQTAQPGSRPGARRDLQPPERRRRSSAVS